MAKIYIRRNINGIIKNSWNFSWDAKEDFTRLKKIRSIRLIDTTAEKIMEREDLIIVDKILLSAVAGAAWQYLIDRELTHEFPIEEFYISISV